MYVIDDELQSELNAILALADDGTHTEIDDQGTKIWRNAEGQIHRDGDLPAMIFANGDVVYRKGGKMHRDGDRPAVICSDGCTEYWFNGHTHRDGGLPAVIYNDGFEEFWVEGRYIRK